jgi:hypothetical protein
VKLYHNRARAVPCIHVVAALLDLFNLHPDDLPPRLVLLVRKLDVAVHCGAVEGAAAIVRGCTECTASPPAHSLDVPERRSDDYIMPSIVKRVPFRHVRTVCA